MFPNVVRMRRVECGYEVEAGHSLAGAVVTMSMHVGHWDVESIRRTIRFGPIALLLLAVIAWWLRRQLPAAFIGALTGLTFGIPIGLLLGFGFQLGLLDPQFPLNSTGNAALNIAIFISLTSCIAGVVIQTFWYLLRCFRDVTVHNAA